MAGNAIMEEGHDGGWCGHVQVQSKPGVPLATAEMRHHPKALVIFLKTWLFWWYDFMAIAGSLQILWLARQTFAPYWPAVRL